MPSSSRMEARYLALGLQAALARRCDYEEACNMLLALLKEAYSLSHKSLQARMFQDVLQAIRVLPEMQSDANFAAALSLSHALQRSLPKQKSAIAASEYRSAAITWRRNMKHRAWEQVQCPHLAQDLVLHIFSYLDGPSLATAACVCRAWNTASMEEAFWRKQLLLGYGNVLIDARVLQRSGFRFRDCSRLMSCRLNELTIESEGSWREAFKLLSKRWPAALSVFKKAHCQCCKAIFWPSQLHNLPPCRRNGPHKLNPFLPNQVVSYVLMGSLAPFPHTSDSDSDEGDLEVSKLWAYARSYQT